MDRSELEMVVRSFVRVKSEPFARSFYARFLARDVAIERLFADTDSERQNELFVHGVYALLDHARDGATALGVRRLRQTHGSDGMRITRGMFEIWVECLMEALAEHDPHWSPQLADRWSAVLRAGVDAMLASDV